MHPHLNRQTRDVEPVGEEDALAKQSLVTCRELDLRDGEGMAQMQAAVHVGEGEVAEPLGELFADLGCAEALGLLLRWRVDLEDALFAPLLLVLFLKRGEVIALARLRSIVSSWPQAWTAHAPGPSLWSRWRSAPWFPAVYTGTLFYNADGRNGGNGEAP